VGRLVFGGRAWRTISKYSPAFAYGGWGIQEKYLS
jgi:hypothetical protein